MKHWSMTIGMAIGLAVGAVLWWGSYDPGEGIFQNVQLVVVPAALAILIVAVRNKRNKVGPYDPDIIARNKRGRL
jgi:peptidoglycan/LPS O-acetylase OafA/YrhL